jgi:hypothetical protein
VGKVPATPGEHWTQEAVSAAPARDVVGVNRPPTTASLVRALRTGMPLGNRAVGRALARQTAGYGYAS